MHEMVCYRSYENKISISDFDCCCHIMRDCPVCGLARCQILSTLKMSIPIIWQTLDETFLLSSAFVAALAFLADFQFHEKHEKKKNGKECK